ncbi:MAG: PorP/SprF family type IX secretion system membrane protein [Saprospiraceae bacterium]|nr:PorP/SprF family type IX secretion system membrane protein [Saprospiraceae bacterium]
MKKQFFTKGIRIFVFLIFILNYFESSGQDLHYSQFYNSPQNHNPALTGVFNGDHRVMISIRDQWRFVPVPWFTFSGAYDRQFYLKNNSKHFIGAGVNLNHDRQGDSKLNLTSLNFSGSYHRVLHPNHIVSGGLVLGFASRGFNTEFLTWDKQWSGDAFNAQLPSGELFENLERIYFFETGLGLNYRYQLSSRTNVDLGVSGLHMIPPTAAFYNTEDTKLPRRFTLTAVGNLKVTEQVDVQLNFMQQYQGEYEETILGGLGKLYLSQKKGNEIQIHAGLGYRTAGSLFPVIAVQYNNYYASISFDFDSSELNRILSSSRGGPEIHFRYIIANVKPLNTFKVCPIY